MSALFDSAQTILSGVDAAAARSYREEDRRWRGADLKWREEETEHFERVSDQRAHEQAWRIEDLEQRGVAHARRLWARYRESNRRDVEERTEQLRSFSTLSAYIAGFAVTGLIQFNLLPTQSHGNLLLFGLTTAIVMALTTNSMMTFGLLHSSLMKTARAQVSVQEEAIYTAQCREYAVRYQTGDCPPAPRRSLQAHWQLRCAGDYQRAFYMFSAGVIIFMANLCFAAWLQFATQPRTAIVMTVILGIGALYFAFAHLRWAAHIMSPKTAQATPVVETKPQGLPFDWHLRPETAKRF